VAGLKAMRFAIIDAGPLDLREDLAGAVVQRADRPAFALMGRKLRPELGERVPPIGKFAGKILRTPTGHAMDEDDVP